MKLLGTVFGSVEAERDIWEPRISKLEKALSLWRSLFLSMVGRVLVLNILGLSRLLFVSRVLEPPNWVWARVYSLIRPFLWGSKIETIARKTIICPLKEGGLGLKDFRLQGRASRLAALHSLLNTRKAFFLLKYICSFQLSILRPEWQDLGGKFNTERNASYSLLFAAVGDFAASDYSTRFFLHDQCFLFFIFASGFHCAHFTATMVFFHFKALLPFTSLESCA